MKDLKNNITKYVINNFAFKLKEFTKQKPIQFEIDNFKTEHSTYFAESNILDKKMQFMFCDLSYEDTEYVFISQFDNLPIYIIHYSLFNDLSNWIIKSEFKSDASNIQIFEYLVGIEKILNMGFQIKDSQFNEEFYNIALEIIKE